jgi:tRNA modification GTPase
MALPYIQQNHSVITEKCRMCRQFTGFLNGKIRPSQTEAVADLISSDNEASHQIICNKCVDFSNEITKLREEHFAPLIELRIRFCRRKAEDC